MLPRAITHDKEKRRVDRERTIVGDSGIITLVNLGTEKGPSRRRINHLI